jgi:leucyl/phenylalanyl-tRNA--protein transferase
MQKAYERLHDLGWAHSFEAWDGEALIAGMYGVAIGRVFFGESMFARMSDSSKIVFVRSIEYLQARGVELIDCQVWSDHLESLGARTLPRNVFLQQLDTLCEPRGEPGSWNQDHERYTAVRDD